MTHHTTSVFNRRAKFNYHLYDRFEAGIVLIGAEVKAVRTGNADISQSHAKFIGNELFLINASIPVPGKKDYSPTRPRKLLTHKSEARSLLSKLKAKKLTLVPTKMYTKGRLIKLELALAKFKRQAQKRDSLKKKDLERDIARDLKNIGDD